MNKEIEYHHIECDCHSSDHILRFVYVPRYELYGGVEEPELYTEVQLHQCHNIFKRIWLAIKYIFGYKCRYGLWDCVLINEEEAAKLLLILTSYINDCEDTKEIKS